MYINDLCYVTYCTLKQVLEMTCYIPQLCLRPGAHIVENYLKFLSEIADTVLQIVCLRSSTVCVVVFETSLR
jgi:hypothetical protein